MSLDRMGSTRLDVNLEPGPSNAHGFTHKASGSEFLSQPSNWHPGNSREFQYKLYPSLRLAAMIHYTRARLINVATIDTLADSTS